MLLFDIERLDRSYLWHPHIGALRYHSRDGTMRDLQVRTQRRRAPLRTKRGKQSTDIA